MYIDNLTIAGILAASIYGLLPMLFGREFLRVEDDEGETGRQTCPGHGRIPSSSAALQHNHQSPCAEA